MFTEWKFGLLNTNQSNQYFFNKLGIYNFKNRKKIGLFMVLDLVDKFNLDYLFNKGKLRF